MKNTQEIHIAVQQRISDGQFTVGVQLVGWPVQLLTTLGHNKLLQSRIGNKVALAVHDALLKNAEAAK